MSDILRRRRVRVNRSLPRSSHRGPKIDRTGDGFLATFDGPARAVRCAIRIRDELRASLGPRIRVALHTGEIVRRSAGIGGIAVHLAARVLALAEAGEVPVPGTVADLVLGAGIEFEERGSHALEGVPGTWRLLRVTRWAPSPTLPERP